MAVGLIEVIDEERDSDGEVKHARVERDRYVESDTAPVNRTLGREVGGKQNILVLNDEAHHAYRIRKEEPDTDEDDVSAAPKSLCHAGRKPVRPGFHPHDFRKTLNYTL